MSSTDLDDLYQEVILEHGRRPRHAGKPPRYDASARGDNPLCGDVVRIELQIDDRGTLREVFFDGDGCCISQAAASMIVEKFDGRTVEEVKKFTANDMLELFGARLTPNRQRCCLLPWRVLQSAIYSPVATPTPTPTRSTGCPAGCPAGCPEGSGPSQPAS